VSLLVFDYLFDVPVEEIDLTFDKPFLYMIRDTKTGEIWFMGTVYEGKEYK
jgi:serine protease inhibitor